METATQNAAMTIIRLITNNYLQTPCSLSSSCGETQLDIALQNPLPSPTGILLLSVSLSLHPAFSLLFLLLFIPSVIHVVLFQSLSISSLSPFSFFFSFFFCLLPPPRHFPAKSPTSCLFMCVARRSPPPLLSLVFLSLKD